MLGDGAAGFVVVVVVVVVVVGDDVDCVVVPGSTVVSDGGGQGIVEFGSVGQGGVSAKAAGATSADNTSAPLSRALIKILLPHQQHQACRAVAVDDAAMPRQSPRRRTPLRWRAPMRKTRR
jgi:hypothetical protein